MTFSPIKRTNRLILLNNFEILMLDNLEPENEEIRAVFTLRHLAKRRFFSPIQ